MKKIVTLFLMMFTVWPLWAQFQDPVSFSVDQKKLSDSEFEIVFTGKVDAGWHVYSTDIPDGGPTPATITFEELSGAEPVGKLRATGQVHRAYDNIFEMEVSYMEGSAGFVQKMRITKDKYTVKGYLGFGACNDENCMPPSSQDFMFSGTGKPAAAKADKPAAVEPAKDKAAAEAPAAEEKDAEDTAAEAEADTVAVQQVADTGASALGGGSYCGRGAGRLW